MTGGSPDPYDPFRDAREKTGTLRSSLDGLDFTMVLRHADVKRVARDYRAFSSNTPFCVPIPPEHDLRPCTQLPIESDPPEHGKYRRLMDERFGRAAMETHREQVELIAQSLLDPVRISAELEVVDQFALPLFLRTLALVLGRPQNEVPRWLSWGTHALSGSKDQKDGLNHYIDAAVDHAIAHAASAPGSEPPTDNPEGADFFSELASASIDDRSLSRDEIRGFANLAFAGGRQTTVFVLSSAIHHLAANRADLDYLSEDPTRIPVAVEEFLRLWTPVTHLGRTATAETKIVDQQIHEGDLVSLCFQSANRDEREFPDPATLLIDRRPNRHIAFGHGPHTCVGAPMARMVLQVALECLVSRYDSLAVVGTPVPHLEDYGADTAMQGYDHLRVALSQRPAMSSDNEPGC